MTRWLQIAAFPLAALALGFATMFVFPEGFSLGDETEADPEFPRISWQETAPRVQSGRWLLVDARDEEQFAAKHIPGSISLPAQSYPEMLEFFAEEHGMTKTVVIYCGTEDCDLSTELALRLRDEIGFTDIRVLDGGFLAWLRSKGETEP